MNEYFCVHEYFGCYAMEHCHVFYSFHQALQQNEIMNVFHIDWAHLGDSDDAFGSKADNHMKVVFHYIVYMNK